MADNTHDKYGNTKEYVESVIAPRRPVMYPTGHWRDDEDAFRELEKACTNRLSHHRGRNLMYMPNRRIQSLDSFTRFIITQTSNSCVLYVESDTVKLVDTDNGALLRSEEIKDQKNYNAIADMIIIMCCPYMSTWDHNIHC